MNDKPTYQELENQIAELKKHIEFHQLDSSVQNELKTKSEVEKALKESKEEYRLLAENSSDVIWVLNITHQKFKYISPAIYRLRGLTVDEALNESISDALTPDSLELVISLLNRDTPRFIKNPDNPCYSINELRQTHKNGSLVWVEVSSRYRMNEIGEIELIAVSRNIDERKRADEKLIAAKEKAEKNEVELRELNAIKDKLFSIIAHDLRSPFNHILSFSELLIENVKDLEITETEKYLGIINSSANHTLILLDNLLNWAKSQTGKIYFNPEKLFFSNVILEIIELKKSIANSKKISLNYFSSDEIEVYADENMLKTILRNLISNAIKFTNSGGKIDIYAITITEPKQVEITISDNGIGMSEDIKDKVFSIGAQISQTGTANEKGSGLGLILCKEFIEKHGGKIWVESKLGKGSDFKFTLPLNSIII